MSRLDESSDNKPGSARMLIRNLRKVDEAERRIRAAIRHIDATLTEHAGDIPRGELVKVWDILEGRPKTTEVSDADSK